MKKFTRILSLFCALLLALSTLSCSDSQTPSETADDSVQSTAADAETVSTEEEEILPDLPETDFEGRIFNVLGRENPTYSQFNNFEIYAEEENGQPVNDAVFRRNTALEDRYNVKITQQLFDNTLDTLKTSITADDDLYSLAFFQLENCGAAAQSGYLYNLNTVEHIDFEKPWWNPEVNSEVSVLGRLYYTSSDFSLRDKNRAYIMIYNQDLANQYSLPNFIDIVREGGWTLDRMKDFCEQVSGDVDGDGAMTDLDSYGLVMDSYNSFPAFAVACDNPMISQTEDGSLNVTMNTERMVDTVDRLIRLTCDKNIALFCDDFNGKVSYDYWSVSGTVFNAGRALFSTAFPHSLASKSENCEFNYTVIPFPKLDEAQERYLTMPDIFAMLFGIPSVCRDPAFSGFMLEALSAASMTSTLPAYYEVSCKTKYAANPESAEMLDVIFAGICYDNGILFRSNINLYNILGVTIPGAKQNNFESEFKKIEKVAVKMLAKIVGTFEELEG